MKITFTKKKHFYGEKYLHYLHSSSRRVFANVVNSNFVIKLQEKRLPNIFKVNALKDGAASAIFANI